ncbi:MAG: hypothetical protein OCC49_15360 [Fibrobacterales bacterium]
MKTLMICLLFFGTTYVHSSVNDINTYTDAQFSVGETAQLFGGALTGGVLIGIAGGVFGSAFNESCGDDDFICIPGGTIIGSALGIELGLIAGTHIVGHMQGKRSSIIATTLGTLISTVGMFYYIQAINNIELTDSAYFVVGSSLFVLASGPVLGYTLFADEKVTAGETSLYFDRTGALGVRTSLISMTF